MTYIQSTIMLFRQMNDATVANTTTDTSSIGTGLGDRILSANFWQAGRTIRVKGGGIYTTPAVSNVLTKVKFGSTTLLSKTTAGLLNAQTNMSWSFEITCTCQSVTSGVGTFTIAGQLLFDIGQAFPAIQFINTTGAKPTASVTTEQLFDITNAWDSTTPTRSVTTQVCTIERLG